MPFREPSETSRERQMALVWWLSSSKEGMTQRDIVEQVTVTGPSDGTNVRTRVKAYEGAPDTIRAKFERDKVDLRNAGFEISLTTRIPRIRSTALKKTAPSHPPSTSPMKSTTSLLWPFASVASESPAHSHSSTRCLR